MLFVVQLINLTETFEWNGVKVAGCRSQGTGPWSRGQTTTNEPLVRPMKSGSHDFNLLSLFCYEIIVEPPAKKSAENDHKWVITATL